MKQLTLGFSILVLVSVFTFGLKSCTGRGGDFVPRVDTIQIVFRQKMSNLVFMDSAIRTISKVRKFKDSNSLDAAMTIDTSFRIYQAIDTLRDSAKHPLFDLKHNPMFRSIYLPNPVPDSLNKYIQVINIPSWNGKK